MTGPVAATDTSAVRNDSVVSTDSRAVDASSPDAWAACSSARSARDTLALHLLAPLPCSSRSGSSLHSRDHSTSGGGECVGSALTGVWVEAVCSDGQLMVLSSSSSSSSSSGSPCSQTAHDGGGVGGGDDESADAAAGTAGAGARSALEKKRGGRNGGALSSSETWCGQVGVLQGGTSAGEVTFVCKL